MTALSGATLLSWPLTVCISKKNQYVSDTRLKSFKLLWSHALEVYMALELMVTKRDNTEQPTDRPKDRHSMEFFCSFSPLLGTSLTVSKPKPLLLEMV